MRIQTFVGKVGVDTLHDMDDHINKWIEDHNIEPKMVTQSCGSTPQGNVQSEELMVITSIWY